MKYSNKVLLLVIGAIFIGAISGLILASNMDWTIKGIASSNDSKNVVIGSSEPPLQTDINLQQLDNAFVAVAKEVKPAVVTITSAKIIKFRRLNPFSDFFGDDFFHHFFQAPDRERNRDNNDEEEEYRQQGLGSGVIVSSDGYIITNNHVIKDADEIKVITVDKKEYDAEIVGTDAKTDVAVIKINADNLASARLGNSDLVQVGQWVLAIGSPFSQELEHTVTHGIVSAKGRSNFRLADYEDFIQTDAAINPGNSGGALVNLKGELIGINTAIVSGGGTAGNVGIGFAIPINMASHVMEMLIKKGRVIRGWLGVQIQDIDDEMAQVLGMDQPMGALVAQVIKGEPAEESGIEEGDVIIKINDEDVRDRAHLSLKIASFDPGTKVKLTIMRNGKEKVINVTLGEREEEKEVAQTKPKSSEKTGLRVEDLTRESAAQYGYEGDEGALVTYVKRGSIAYREGIREGDLIKEINRKRIRTVEDFNSEINSIEANEIVFMRLRKGDNHYYVSFKMPEDK